MAVQFDPIAKDESLNTTEQTARNIADVLAQELSDIATAISGGSDKAPKTDIATVEPTNVASRAYNIGELVYVNGNLYEVITVIASGATFTVNTNIKSTNVSGALRGSEWTVVNSNLRYRIVGGVVYVYVKTGTAGTWENTGSIPSEISPEENIYQTYYSDGSSNFSIATINTAGNVLTLATLAVSGIFSYPLK